MKFSEPPGEYADKELSGKMNAFAKKIADTERSEKNLRLLAALLLERAGGSVTIPVVEIALRYTDWNRATIGMERIDGSVVVTLKYAESKDAVERKE